MMSIPKATPAKPSAQSTDWRNAYEMLAESGLFDQDWYLREYGDVAWLNVPPMEHFIKIGLLLGRRPTVDAAWDDFKPRLMAVLAPQNSEQLRPRKSRPADRPLVSVLTLAYNHEKYIREMLDGAVSQKTDFDFEIVVGDDCSTDRTADIVREYAAIYPNIVPILRQTNIGPGPNFLDVASRLRGKYVALCEGDDYWTDELKLQSQVDFLEENPEYSVCFHPVRVLFEDAPSIIAYFPSENAEWSYNLLAQGNFIQTNSAMYRWRFPGGMPSDFDSEAVPGDWYLHMLHAETGRIGYIDKTMGVYRRHASGMWAQHSGEKNLHARYGRRQIRLFNALGQRYGGRFESKFRDDTIYVLNNIVSMSLESSDFQTLYSICNEYPDFVKDVFGNFGYDINVKTITSESSIEDTIRKQGSISVIVTSYNHGKYIERCLDSIIEQVGPFQLQIVIGDDCSKDDTKERVANYFRDRNLDYAISVHIVESDSNVGMLKNIKRCISLATGRFIAMCEGDDYWLSKHKLRKQLDFMLKNQDHALCFNWILLRDERSGTYIPHEEQSRLEATEVTFEMLASYPIIANFSCCFYRAAAMRTVPESYYADKSAADWLFNLHVATQGKIGFLRELMSVYVLHEKGQWSGLPPKVQSGLIEELRMRYRSIFSNNISSIETKRNISVKLLDNILDFEGGACLDAPTTETLLPVTQKYVSLKGWVVSKHIGELNLIAESPEGKKLIFNRNMVRADVAEAHGNPDWIPAKCGFEFKLPTEGRTTWKIALRVGRATVDWLEVKIA